MKMYNSSQPPASDSEVTVRKMEKRIQTAMGSKKICEEIGLVLTTGQRTTEMEGAAEQQRADLYVTGKQGRV